MLFIIFNSMRIVILAFALLTGLLSKAQSDDEIIVRKILSEQTQSWNKGDITGFMKGYWQNDSLVFIGQSGITYGWNSTLVKYKEHYPDTTAMGKLSFDILLVKRLSFQYFHVMGKWHLQRSQGNLDGQFTLLFKKIKGVWVIISDHSS